MTDEARQHNQHPNNKEPLELDLHHLLGFCAEYKRKQTGEKKKDKNKNKKKVSVCAVSKRALDHKAPLRSRHVLLLDCWTLLQGGGERYIKPPKERSSRL